MKIDRLIGILTVLLQKERVTAPDLAKRFEVSRRTISRDVEDLCRAGIPIVTVQGRKGGISVMEGYRMDKTLLTDFDMGSILTGLQGLDSISSSAKYRRLMEKLAPGGGQFCSADKHIIIDLSSWYKSSLAPKIDLLQEAAVRHEKISFCYYTQKGEGNRVIEPYQLIFQWSAWYIWGYCGEKKGFRLFKLNRMTGLENTGEIFEERRGAKPDLKTERVFPSVIRATVRIEPSAVWRIVDEYGAESLREAGDGTFLFEFDFTSREYLIRWLLSLGEGAQLLEPAELKPELARTLENMLQKYTF